MLLVIGVFLVQKNTFGLSSNTRLSGNTALGHAFSFRQLDPAMFQTAIRQTQRWGPVSVSGPSAWDLWWTKYHLDSFLTAYFSFPVLLSFHQWSICILLFIAVTT